MYIRNSTTSIHIIDQPLSFKIILEFDVYTIDERYAGIGEDILVDRNGKPTFLIVECNNDSFSFKRYIAVPFACIHIDLDLEIISICWTKRKLDESPDFFFGIA